MNAAVVTARGGSKSIPGKNILAVGGKPLLVWQINAAQAAKGVDAVYVSTDCPEIAFVARAAGAEVIWRPAELAGDTADHGDAIKHAAHEIDRLNSGALDILVVLLGNTAMVDGDDIDACIHAIEENPFADSAMTVWEAADDHPLRALTINEEGYLSPYPTAERKAPCNRQEYPTVYYYDNGVWALRKYCVESRDGLANPWWWMGKRSVAVVRPWVTGRDVHGPLDVGITEWWLRGGKECAR